VVYAITVLILYKSFNFFKTVGCSTNHLFLIFTKNVIMYQYQQNQINIDSFIPKNTKFFFFPKNVTDEKKGNNYIYRNKRNFTFLVYLKFLNNFKLSLLFSFFFRKGVGCLISFLFYNFKNGYNVLFFDSIYNFNYIPVSNKRLLKRSKKKLKKLFKFFHVNCVILLDVSNKRFIFKKLKKRGMLIISSESKIFKKFLDFSIITQSYLTNYLLYLLVIFIYKKVKTDLFI